MARMNLQIAEELGYTHVNPRIVAVANREMAPWEEANHAVEHGQWVPYWVDEETGEFGRGERDA